MRNEEAMAKFKTDPLLFVFTMWHLEPQPIKPEYKNQVRELIATSHAEWEEAKKNIHGYMFGEFVKGRHLTWQQWVFFLCLEKALKGDASRRISAVSGHGTGKSCDMSMVILWFLFCFYNAQIPCTAPTSDQMYDILWKEIAVWLHRMPPQISILYQWESSHVRMQQSPETWFARAKTASKENPEALAGVHGDNVCMIIDEASGVFEQIFNTAEGALTNENILVIMVSNGTRDYGYFYDSHHKMKELWQNIAFDSEESPIVDKKYMESMAARHGADSVEYGIRVKGQFPGEAIMDDEGYIRLIETSRVHFAPTTGWEFRPNAMMGVDPSGDGDDTTAMFIRDQFKAMRIFKEMKSTAKSVAAKAITFIKHYDLSSRNVGVDNFGIGADVGKEAALESKGKIDLNTINTGDPCEDPDEKEMFINVRAMLYWKLRTWALAGGEIGDIKEVREEIESLFYKRAVGGKIQMMPKLLMKKKGFKSPDNMDALSLTFLGDVVSEREEKEARRGTEDTSFNETDDILDRFRMM